jgi:hypothetical protein
MAWAKLSKGKRVGGGGRNGKRARERDGQSAVLRLHFPLFPVSSRLSIPELGDIKVDVNEVILLHSEKSKWISTSFFTHTKESAAHFRLSPPFYFFFTFVFLVGRNRTRPN